MKCRKAILFFNFIRILLIFFHEKVLTYHPLKRTIENWEAGLRNPPVYVEKLIIEKLMQIKGGLK